MGSLEAAQLASKLTGGCCGSVGGVRHVGEGPAAGQGAGGAAAPQVQPRAHLPRLGQFLPKEELGDAPDEDLGDAPVEELGEALQLGLGAGGGAPRGTGARPGAGRGAGARCSVELGQTLVKELHEALDLGQALVEELG